ncbi:MAG: ABC transporter permease [Clostridia bacterium]|nr:ABC transporter permease [Clostridia bacterium]MDE6605244.1 ABC transporter permease [Clostridia bacterium]MDE6869247.1 ABC transporter permease [Clostridia bacterium]MDE7208568.1 ABC transporter permease [Clostridia bacterium]
MFKKSLAIPYALFMAIFVLLPLVLVLVFAFIDASDGSFDMITNFKELAKEQALGKVIGNSLIAGLSTSALCLLIGYPIAYYLTKTEFNKKGVMIGLFLAPMWVNFLLRMMATKAVFNVIGFKMGMGAVIFGLTYEFLPYMIMPLYNTLLKIDKCYIEGASDLGATPIRAFWKITVPLSMPGIVSGLTMVMIPSITTFAVTEIMSNGKMMLLGDFIYSLKADSLNMAAAISFILLIFMCASMIISNKYSNDSGSKGGGLW